MFEMYKYILAKVSFDKYIFKKELKKAFTQLKDEEKLELKSWCISNFDQQYNGVLNEVFHESKNGNTRLIMETEDVIAA